MPIGLRDKVITPSGALARVLSVRMDGRLELEYIHALNPATAQFALAPKLLRKFDRDLPRPTPVRIGGAK